MTTMGLTAIIILYHTMRIKEIPIQSSINLIKDVELFSPIAQKKIETLKLSTHAPTVFCTHTRGGSLLGADTTQSVT